MFQNIRSDYITHGRKWFAQGFLALLVYRYGRWRYTLSWSLHRKVHSTLYQILFKGVQFLCGIELPCEAKVGQGLRIDHFGGVVVSGFAQIGDHCVLRSGVVIGLARVDDPCAPVIGNHVEIGTGAKLLGRIHVGDHAVIGANAVVVKDVPAWSVATGVPAVIRPRKDAPAGFTP